MSKERQEIIAGHLKYLNTLQDEAHRRLLRDGFTVEPGEIARETLDYVAETTQDQTDPFGWGGALLMLLYGAKLAGHTAGTILATALKVQECIETVYAREEKSAASGNRVER